METENLEIICIYCSSLFKGQTLDSTAELIRDHHKTCEKHPLRRAEGKIVKLTKALKETKEAFNKAHALLLNIDLW